MISRIRGGRFACVAFALVAVVCAACAAPEADAQDAAVAHSDGAALAAGAMSAQELACAPQRPPEDRPSPYDSVTVQVGAQQAKICYSRPFARDREIMGGLLPYGELWRTGANEPTTIHIPFAADIAGVGVEPGSYSIYTIPDREEWTVIVNRSTSQWGVESAYTAELEAQEAGRGTVPVESAPERIEQFTIRSEPAGDNGADVILEWEETRVRIPITVAS